MGDLIRTPHSEVTKLLEILDHHGVTSHDLEVLRKASSWSQETVARVHKTDPSVWAALEFEDAAVRVGFAPNELRQLAQNEDVLRQMIQVARGNAEIKMLEFWRTLEDLQIRIPVLKQPTLGDLRKRFDWIKKIGSDASPTDTLTLQLGTVLRSDEDSIVGTEYERRRGLRQGWLGFQQAVWLVDHQDEFPQFMALLGKVYIDFPGLVVVNAGGLRFFPCLGVHGGCWGLGWGWAGSVLDRGGRVASK